jgi:hypothetical protein
MAGGKIAGFKEYRDTHKAAQAYNPQGAGTAAGRDAPRPTIH